MPNVNQNIHFIKAIVPTIKPASNSSDKARQPNHISFLFSMAFGSGGEREVCGK